MHCSGVQAIIRSTRGRFAGSSCRPGCFPLLFFFVVVVVAGDAPGKGSRWLSASTSLALTPGSRSSNCNWLSLSFSLLAPYLRIISRRRRSSNAWIFNRDHSSSFVSSTICSASERGGEEGDGLTIGSIVTIADHEQN